MQKDSIESWNQLFPNAPIRQSDLVQPTEAFLTKCLISYLQILGLKVEPPNTISEESKIVSQEYRKFLIKVVLQIDKILKITNKTYSFLYYDLIHPSPRKTSHTLNILLNYLFYYNMYKTKVYDVANEKIKKYEDVKRQVDEAQKNVDTSRKKSEKIKQKLIDYQNRIIKMQTKHVELKQQNSKLSNELASTEKFYKKLLNDFQALDKEKHNLSAQVVTNEEVHDFKVKLSNIKQTIDTQLKYYEEIGSNHKDCIASIEKQKKLCKMVTNVIDNFPMSVLSDFKANQQKLKEEKELSASLAAKKKQNEQLRNVAEIESKSNEVIENNRKLENEIEDLNKQLNDFKQFNMQHRQNERRIKELHKEEHNLNVELEKHQDTNEMIQAMTEELLYK